VPWSVADVDRFRKDLNPADKERWVSVANAVRDEKLAGGATEEEADAAAVIAANAALKDRQQESVGGRILQAFYEDAEPRVIEQSVATGLRMLMGQPGITPQVKVTGQALLEALNGAGGGTNDSKGVLTTAAPLTFSETTYTIDESTGRLVRVTADSINVRESGALIPFEGA
jgi:hypothetical protein